MKPILFFGFFLFIFSASPCAQNADTVLFPRDSVNTLTGIDSISVDSVKTLLSNDSIDPVDTGKVGFVIKNKLLNSETEPVSLAVQFKKVRSGDGFFYLVAGLLLMLAFLRYAYTRYFTNIFRVFFNTSLRQNQITDQLLLAKLPSFLYNILFVASGGIYAYVLLAHYQLTGNGNEWIFIFVSVALIGLIYSIKYCSLKFIGWLTGLEDPVKIYVFVTFLINKITGIILVPFIILLTFAEQHIAGFAALVSLVCIGILLLLRFFRSYGLIQNQLKISKFHFFLYIAGLEILPLLLIYKGLMGYLTKNL